MSGHNNRKEKPYKPSQQVKPPPTHCSKCLVKFDEAIWPRSGYTLTGFSPWCPTCHGDFSGNNFFKFNNRSKPGPKPKLPETWASTDPVQVRSRHSYAGDFQRAKTHCPRGHEYNEANTYHGKKGRSCRVCRRDDQRARKAAKRAAA
jgi:hypothetical protein